MARTEYWYQMARNLAEMEAHRHQLRKHFMVSIGLLALALFYGIKTLVDGEMIGWAILAACPALGWNTMQFARLLDRTRLTIKAWYAELEEAADERLAQIADDERESGE